MASKIIAVMVDDLTGKELKTGQGETVSFALDGVQYELDVDSKTAAKVRGSFEQYIEAGRRIGKSGRVMQRKATGADPAAVRAWAAANKIKVSDRGRIPADVLEQYQAAGN